jgi:hypothetical protein
MHRNKDFLLEKTMTQLAYVLYRDIANYSLLDELKALFNATPLAIFARAVTAK